MHPSPEALVACLAIVGAEFEGSATHAAGTVGFFELSGSSMLALYPRRELASV